MTTRIVNGLPGGWALGPEMKGQWISCEALLPADNLVVETKIHDGDGLRNQGPLKRQGRLWFLPDGSMYVYYTPTHWRNP